MIFMFLKVFFRELLQKAAIKMNAVIALCHFCESHGPSILFCTQVCKYSNFSV